MSDVMLYVLPVVIWMLGMFATLFLLLRSNRRSPALTLGAIVGWMAALCLYLVAIGPPSQAVRTLSTFGLFMLPMVAVFLFRWMRGDMRT